MVKRWWSDGRSRNGATTRGSATPVVAERVRPAAPTGSARSANGRGADERPSRPAAPDWVDVDGGPLVTVADVQRDCLVELLAVARSAGVRLVLTDIHSSPVVDLWLTDLDRRESFVQALGRTDLRVAVVHDDGVEVVPARQLTDTVTGVGLDSVRSLEVYRRHHVAGYVVHGRGTAVRVVLPVLDEEAGRLVSPRSRVTTSMPVDGLDELPRTTFLGVELPTGRSLARIRELGTIPEVVDVVYTWVDGTDPGWLARRAAAKGSGLTSDAADAARFRSTDELRYSLRSVLTNLRGVGTIFVVTDQQRPACLAELGDRVRLVDHREVFPDPSVLPTFNSHAIEAQLHRIDGLREHFLYFNDDVFLGQPTTPAFYFDEYGRTRHFYSGTVTIPEGPLTPDLHGADVAARNAQAIVEARFGIHVTRKFKHTPIALRRSVVEEIESEIPDVFRTTGSNRFRSVDDVAVAGSLHHHWAAATGRAVPGRVRYRYLDTGRDDFAERLRRSGIAAAKEAGRPDVFCINSTRETAESDANIAAALAALARAFPLPAPHEG